MATTKKFSGGPNPDKAKLGPPPRWLKCPRKGLVYAGRFVPLKTPLCSLYDEYVPEWCRFYPKMLFDSMQSQYKIGFWIDLTNTDRFYPRHEIETMEAHYMKLHCKGHGECPSEQQTEAFIQICRQFWTDHPRQLIAVHCTHGFNRTGFLICSYMVEEKDWSIEAAIREYSNCRPPGIYKQEYLDELFRRYGDADDVPVAPPLPDWCDESEPILNDDETESVPSTSKMTQFMDGALPAVRPVGSGPKRTALQQQCQRMCNRDKKGFPGSQPVSMEKSNMRFMQEKLFRVSWKADGVRYMMLINGKEEVYVFDRDHNVFHVPNLDFPHRKEKRNIKDTLLDGEMIVDKVNGESIFRYLVYDIVKFEGQPVGSCDFGRRLHCIQHEIVGPRNHAMMSGHMDRATQTFSVRAKEFWPIEAVEKILSDKFQAGLPHEIDGLIFQPEIDPYEPGRCQSVLKWKPPHLNSVDFKLKIVKEWKPGMLPEWKGYLYVLGMDTPFSLIKMTKELKQYDNKIIECSFEDQTKSWKFLRERTDKSLPNAYATATGVCSSIRYPITKEYLLEFISTKAVKSSRYQQQQGQAQRSTQKRPVSNGNEVSSMENGPVKVPRSEDATPMPPPSFIPPQQRK